MRPLARRELMTIYRRLHRRFGPRHWWPAETPFEVVVGAVLTQNTAWTNVERAIANLKQARALTPKRLLKAPVTQIARWIRPAGYFNLKARRLRAVVAWWQRTTPLSATRRLPGDPPIAGGQPSPRRPAGRRGLLQRRQELLGVYGVGPETADSILLYALGRPSFVVDAYTKRVFARHGWVRWEAGYDEIQQTFTRALPPHVPLYNEYHALLVELGKTLCHARHPNCQACPLRDLGTLRLEPGAR